MRITKGWFVVLGLAGAVLCAAGVFGRGHRRDGFGRALEGGCDDRFQIAGNGLEAPSVITVVTDEEIRNMGARSLTDVLNLIPGFEANRAIMFGVHDTVGVRGRMTDFGEDVLILVDGQRLTRFTRRGHRPNQIHPVDNVKRIELIRARVGPLRSNAFVGIVNILTTPALTSARTRST